MAGVLAFTGWGEDMATMKKTVLFSATALVATIVVHLATTVYRARRHIAELRKHGLVWELDFASPKTSR
jgi:hypothetical protein